MRFALFLAALLIGAAPALADPRLKAVATFSILGDFVREVGGDQVDLVTLVGPDADAHTYQPKPTDARILAGAKVLVRDRKSTRLNSSHAITSRMPSSA